MCANIKDLVIIQQALSGLYASSILYYMVPKTVKKTELPCYIQTTQMLQEIKQKHEMGLYKRSLHTHLILAIKVRVLYKNKHNSHFYLKTSSKILR
jgi:hypothetical protein